MRCPNELMRYCGNCRYFVNNQMKMFDGCTHPLVPNWYPVGFNCDACPLHKFIIDEDEEE